MKTPVHLFVMSILLSAALAQDVRRLTADELSTLDKPPTGTAIAPPQAPASYPKGLVPKGASPASAPMRNEKEREYRATGGLLPKSAGVRPNVVRIKYDDETFIDQPLVEVPLLFRVRTAELLDPRNLGPVIAKLREILSRSPDARFRVEGHASAEGDQVLNEKLARDRAEMVQQTLISALSSYAIRAEGRGVKDARATATAPEAELQLDRRVLVVREK